MNQSQYKKGFSLIEIILVVGIFGLILSVITTFQSNILKSNKFVSDTLSSTQDARVILRVMVKELRSAKPANTGAYPIAETSTSSITFFSDINADNIQEQIRYYIVGTTLKKGIIKPTGSPLVYNPSQETFSTLAYNMKNGTSTALFEYYDNSFTGTTSPLTQPVTVTAVRLVKINLLIDADPNRSPIPRLYTSDATLRNLKDNL